MGRVLLVAVATVIAGSLTAHAEIIQRTKVTHYKISGKTPLGLVKGMHRKAEKSGDRVVLASIATRAQYKMEFPTNSCRNGNVTVDVKFSMRLPSPREEGQFSRDTAKKFNTFYDFLKRHEEEHRRITLQCISRTQSRGRKLLSGVRSCSGLQAVRAELEQIVAEENKRCRSRHAALDRRDEPRVYGMALYKAANAESSRTGTRVVRPGLSVNFNHQAMEINERK